ncbi:unnamed protein product [Ceutorhynchus assimilis]|uniref:Dual specificity protein phosphatase 19 n=1 Tax=Ceutorhynchus assimilis TaxID=467358 RepID=A0A9N9M999_9CUCU|nr:unnamed protein product [Ceutorhynchus assimilis]
MSFLSALQEKKSKLKPTDTIVTQQDGQKFVESKFEVKKINEVTHGFVVDTKPDDIPAKIIEHLYLGSQDCCELEVLNKFNIKFVLSLGIEASVKSPYITYKFIKMLDLDSIDLNKYLPDCISFIDNCLNCKENVLVHCNAGVSRSASVVMSYLIVQNKLSFKNAYELVKKARPCIRPNDGFMIQLRKLKNN